MRVRGLQVKVENVVDGAEARSSPDLMGLIAQNGVVDLRSGHLRSRLCSDRGRGEGVSGAC